MIMGIWELAFMWHQHNSMEMAAQTVSANLALLDGHGCNTSKVNDVASLLQKKTSYLNLKKVSFNYSKPSSNMHLYTSTQAYKGRPYLTVAINCSSNSDPIIPTVQFKSIHRLMFFSASLPNFRTGERIEIIPDNVMFVSSKHSSVSEY